MKLTLHRKYKLPTYTIGKLYIDNKYFCDTIEDKDRGLRQDMPIEQIKKIKIKNETAIPTGTYEITLNVVSPKYSQIPWYYTNLRHGRVPRLLDVPCWEGVLIHTGNTAADSSGCILVGYNKEKGKVLDSRNTLKKLYAEMMNAYIRGENISIEIK